MMYLTLSIEERHLYHPGAPRSRALKLSNHEKRKMEAALDNKSDPYGWSYTSNSGRVFAEKKAGKIVTWRLCVRRGGPIQNV
jgi:hypothetical protein